MSQFYIGREKIEGNQVVVTGAEAHHLLHTRRIKLGEEVKFTDGIGRQYRAKLISAEKTKAVLELVGTFEEKRLSPFAIALPLIEFDRLEWALEKCTELGCAEFWFVTTDRTQLTLRFETAEKKRLRWHRIALEAMKQSENCYIPDIQPILPLRDLLNQWKGSVIAFDSTGQSLSTRPKLNKPVHPEPILSLSKDEGCFDLAPHERLSTLLLIGPEGGWSREELKLFAQKKVPLFSLGPSTLRTETAAITALILCQNSFT